MNLRRTQFGFTLLELLVAAAITLLLAGLLLTVVTGTLALWRRSQESYSGGAQAALVLDLVERDLQAAIRRGPEETGLAVEVIEEPAILATQGWLFAGALLKPGGPAGLDLLGVRSGGATPSLRDARFGRSGGWLRWVTTNVETVGSLPVVVSYQIVRRPVTGAIDAANPANVRYTLFRAAVSAEQTLANGYSVTAGVYGSAAMAPTGTRAPATVANPNNVDALADNVVDLGVWLYRWNADGSLRRIFPGDGADLIHTASGGANAPDASGYPDVADVMVRILSESGAAQLEQMERGLVSRPPGVASDADWWWNVVEANSRVFVRRIVVGGARP